VPFGQMDIEHEQPQGKRKQGWQHLASFLDLSEYETTRAMQVPTRTGLV